MIKKKSQLLYVIPASIGFLTYGTFGLVSSPFSFWIISWISKKKFRGSFNTSAFRWIIWLFLGFVLMHFKPNSIYERSSNIWGDVYYSPTGVITNQLVNGIKECVVREANGLSTNFLDVDSFKRQNSIFKIKQNKTSNFPNTCFSAIAIQNKKRYLNFFDLFPFKELPNYATFKIDFDKNTGIVSKTCNDPSSYGCNDGNTW